MLRVGMVGFGRSSKVFHAPLIASVEGLELAAVVERHADTATERYPGTRIYRSLDAMLEDASLDLFVIATPTGSHFEQARQILAAGKNLVVDKPMAVHSTEIAQLMQLAAEQNVLLAPFHNLRWNNTLRTLQKLLAEGSLGRVVYVESNWDRFRPQPKAGAWREKLTPGAGILLDLGTHQLDHALVLFGLPDAISADIRRERDGEGPEDFYELRLRYTHHALYSGLSVVLRSNCLGAQPQPTTLLRGTQGSYSKYGLDPQEALLSEITRIPSGPWAVEPESTWGTLALDAGNNTTETHAIEPIYGDYRLFYAGLRDALTGKAAVPVQPVAAWRTARLIEWAHQSNCERREVDCDWGEEPQ